MTGNGNASCRQIGGMPRPVALSTRRRSARALDSAGPTLAHVPASPSNAPRNRAVRLMHPRQPTYNRHLTDIELTPRLRRAFQSCKRRPIR
ncbi:hypothetical protein AQ611_23530 [Burkholderia singularis]|nr:hypothetical protein AQ611_23530 [Burkholderia sp. Bp7605]